MEAVAWISEQKSTLSAVFYLASLLVYLRFNRSRQWTDYVAALALFACALASKTVTATLPGALLVILWWQKGRLAWARDVAPLAPWFAMGAGAGWVTSWVERTYIGAHGAEFALTFGQRCLIAGRAIWFYLGKLVFPVGLTFTYPRWAVGGTGSGVLSSFAVVAVAGGLAMLAWRGRRGPLAVLLLFAGTLFPALGFFDAYPFLYSFVADHFQYLASLAILVPAAGLLARLRRPVVVAGSVIALLGVLTFRQSGMYRDGITLYRETIARNPQSWMAHNNLGTIYSEIPGRSEDAIAEYREALRIRPNYAEAHYNLGNLLFASDLQAAIAEYRAGLSARDDFAELHANLGTALARSGSAEEAIAEYRRALQLKPNAALFHFNLANALSGMPGRLPEAIGEYQSALRWNPGWTQARYNLAEALAETPGRAQEALAQLELVLQVNPRMEAARQLAERLRGHRR